MVIRIGEYTMENSSSQNPNGQSSNMCPSNNYGNNDGNNGNMGNGGNSQVIDQFPQYSIPGVLHFIQHEWAKFEMERSQWEVHKAELEAKIAMLQGERKGQENLKNDLIRRIKMLEYALKQERALCHKLKYGTEPDQGEIVPPEQPKEPEEAPPDVDIVCASTVNMSWKQGRQLLRQYLQEIGYTDTVLDLRSNKIKLFFESRNNNNVKPNRNLPLGHEDDLSGGISLIGQSVNSMDVSSNKRSSESQGRRNNKKTLAESMMLDNEATVIANFEFLSDEADVDMDDDDDDDDEDEDMNDTVITQLPKFPQSKQSVVRMRDVDDTDAEANEVLNELNLLTEHEDLGSVTSTVVTTAGTATMCRPGTIQKGVAVSSVEEDSVDTAFALGELAHLTVNNDVETNYEMKLSEPCRKTWNAKYTLRSHFDGVRALAFHPVEPVLITASEDKTLKLWNLQKTVTTKKSVSLDVEPLYTFRKHLAPVLCVAINATGEQCYSGCVDGHIYCWNVPSANIDPYDSYEPSVLSSALMDHTDAVWCMALHTQKLQLLSCSADGTVKLWSPTQTKSALLYTYTTDAVDGVPTSADFLRNESDRIAVSYTSGACIIFDMETGKPVLRFEKPTDSTPYDQVNKLLCHPTLPLTITAHEDRHIRFYDNSTGKMIRWMVAHLDAVTSLAMDPHGMFLLSGSHDCSIRLWNLDTKTCVQEITAHRKKFDESIYDVAFHPSRPYIASSGADGLAKVFV